MIKKIKDLLTPESEQTKSGNKDQQKIVMIDPAALGLDGQGGIPPEPDLRVLGLFADVHEEKIAELIHALLVLNEINKLSPDEQKKPIEFYISTYGGNADDMFGMYDIMRNIKDTSEIHTIGLGKVMSAGVLLLAAGTKGKRKIGKNCRVMIHSVAAGNQGELSHMVNELEEMKNIQEMYIKCLVADSNLTEFQLRTMLERGVNVYLTAEEAVKYGIADIIV